jgi:hypothetical protein
MWPEDTALAEIVDTFQIQVSGYLRKLNAKLAERIKITVDLASEPLVKYTYFDRYFHKSYHQNQLHSTGEPIES